LLPLAALVLATCLPANLFAATATTPDGNPSGPPPIIHPSPLPPDGDPTGPLGEWFASSQKLKI